MGKAEPAVSVWSEIQSPREMDVARRFEYDEDSLGMIRKWLCLDELRGVIAEVGSGSGYFTEKLLNMCAPDTKIVCIEPDEALRKYASSKLNLQGQGIEQAGEDGASCLGQGGLETAQGCGLRKRKTL